MPDDWIIKGYTIAVPSYVNPQKPVPVEITFDATLIHAPTNNVHMTYNQATLTTLTTPTYMKNDTATIGLK